MFVNVKKLVEKASTSIKPGGNTDGLKASDVDPHMVFHYGIPLGCCMFAYDSIQKILAISTMDGRIKLFGKDNSQTQLESDDLVPSRFLEFVQNQGILVNVNCKNHIEVWDLDKKILSHVQVFEEEITSFTVMKSGPYMYVGDSVGNIKVLKIDLGVGHVVQMKYTIPFSASHGNPTEVLADRAVISIMPQSTAESKRILIIFKDGFITLWEIRESKAIMVTGGSMFQSVHSEAKHVTSACLVCPFGSKVAVGYNNGEILIWSVPTPKLKHESAPEISIQNAPICKVILGFRSEKIPIASLKWTYADAKATRLYVMGASDVASTSLMQVILLNEQTESRTIKLGLHLSEPCLDMVVTSNTIEQNKLKQDFLLLIGKSGNIYMYDDCSIEKYLLQCQSRSPPSLPKEIMVKIPFVNSNITVAKLVTDNPYVLSKDEDYVLLAKDIPSLIPLDTKSRDGGHTNSYQFSGFGKVKNLYITGHSDGTINFWDLSCPLPIPILSLKQQSEDDFSLSGIALTALHFDGTSRVLISGDQSGTVRIFKFKSEPYTAENSFISFQGSTKKGNNHIHSVKVLKVNGSILSLNLSHSSRHLAIGTDQGDVSIVDTEDANIIFQSHIASDICLGIISTQFKTCSVQNFEKNVLVVATKDSSVVAFDGDTGSMLSTSVVRPKKPSRALFMHILDWQDISVRGANISNGLEMSRGSPIEGGIPRQSFILICSEKAAYVYSLIQAIQGVKKVHYKKKFHSTSCCWASTFYTASDVGLMLLFTSGKIEIRSLPELSLLKETSIRGFRYSTPKPNSLSDSSMCSSHCGDFVMANGDQEIFIVSVLLQKESFRILDSISRIYRKDLVLPEDVLASGTTTQKEKKKGIFGSVLKDIKGSKKHMPEMETEDTRESIEELSTIFSNANFPWEVENRDNQAADEDEIDLAIDDIDLDDSGLKPKEQNILAALNKHKLKFQAFTAGKLKQMKVKNEKTISKEEQQQDEKSSAVDQIKKKYGFSLHGESSAAKMAESKLHENLKKLQGISLKTTEMQDTAKSFSSMAKEVLRTTEEEKRIS